MRRLVSLAPAALVLLFVMVGTTSADWRPYRHIHHVDSYIVVNSEPTWMYQVVAYYHIRMNGSSPGYIPNISEDEPMDCRVPYANFYSITITRCNMVRQTRFDPDRWLITVGFRQCFAWMGSPFCSDHGRSIQLRATGHITEMRSW